MSHLNLGAVGLFLYYYFGQNRFFFKVFKHRAWRDAVLGSSRRRGEAREGLEAVFEGVWLLGSRQRRDLPSRNLCRG